MLARVWAPAEESIPGAVRKVRSRFPATADPVVLRAARCRCTGACPSAGLPIFSYAIINLNRLNELEGDAFDLARLMELGVIKKPLDGLKILGTGELTRAVSVKAHLFSKSALEKIQQSGGTAEVI